VNHSSVGVPIGLGVANPAVPLDRGLDQRFPWIGGWELAVLSGP